MMKIVERGAMMSDMKEIQEKLHHFSHHFKSVVLASMTNEDLPYTSYVPFIKHENHYYLIMSKAAKHYQNISLHHEISIMFIEDEKEAENIFFRKRLSYAVSVTFDVDPLVKDGFVKKFGEFVNRLFLMDFVMAKCVIKEGQFIIGPGKAYLVDEHENILSNMTGNQGKGHQMA